MKRCGIQVVNATLYEDIFALVLLQKVSANEFIDFALIFNLECENRSLRVSFTSL